MPSSSEPSPRSSRSRSVERVIAAALATVTVLTSGMCGITSNPASEPDGSAAPAASPFGAPGRVTVVAESDEPIGSVSVEVFTLHDGGEPTLLAHHEGPLPISLSAPRGGHLSVVIRAPGRARHEESFVLEDQHSVRAPLGPGQRLHGRVVDERGAAIAGATLVVVRDGGPERPWTARSEVDGSFTIDTLMVGTYRVEASARAHAATTREGIASNSELSVMLERVGLVSGRVHHPDGSGATGATVVIAGSGLWPPRQVVAGGDGRFRLGDVPPGIYEVRAFAGSLIAEPRRGISVEAGEPLFLTFALVPGATLHGIINDSATGGPVPSAELTIHATGVDLAPRVARSGGDGRFAVAGLTHGSARVNVHAEGYVPATVEWESGEPLRIELEPAATLEGVVVDEEGRPVAGATIEVLGETADGQPVVLGTGAGFRSSVFARQIQPLAMGETPGPLEVVPGPVLPIPMAPSSEAPLSVVPPSATEIRVAASYVSDAEGRFRVSGVPPGHVQVAARRAGRAPGSTPRLYVDASMVRQVELVLPPAGALRATVRDARGAGVEGVLVDLRSDREPHPRVVMTDRQGEIVLSDVVGEVTVTALPRGRPPARATISVPPGGEVSLELPLAGDLHELAGRVVDPEGFPLGGAQVLLTALSPDAPLRRTVFAARDGTFSVPDLPAPPWRLEASTAGFAVGRLDLLQVEPRAVSLTLERAVLVRGEVLDDFRSEGVPARVVLIRDSFPAEVLEERADAQGAFAFPQVRAGRWELRVESGEHVGASVTLEVERQRAPRDRTLEPIRLIPAGRLEGTVVDALGAPVARARVWVDGTATGVRADGRGQFTLRGLPPGLVVTRASHPAAGEGAAREARVMAGRETPGLVVRLPERFDPARAGRLPGQRQGVAVLVATTRDEVRVRHVVVDSHAARAGLRAGDVLEAIDGVEPGGTAEASRLLRGAPTVPATLVVRRGAQRAVLLVERERWTPPEGP